MTAADYVMSQQNALSDQISHLELPFTLKNAQLIKEKKFILKSLESEQSIPRFLKLNWNGQIISSFTNLPSPFFFPIFGPIREPKWFNGPYLVRKHNKKQILIERNPYYWDSKRIFFDQIDLSWNHDVDAIYTLSEGCIDFSMASNLR